MARTNRERYRRIVATPPDALRDRIRARVAETGASTLRTRDRAIVALIVAPLLAAVVVLAASELVYHRPAVGLVVDAGRSTRLLWTLFALGAVTALSTLIAMRRGGHGFGAGALSLAIAAAFVAPAYAALTLVQPIHVDDAAATGVAISPWGVRCALIAGLVGMTVMMSFAMALRRAVPVASGLRGAAIGAAAGAWAGIAVFVFCPSGDQPHLLIGHLTPVIALILAGALALPRLLRP